MGGEIEDGFIDWGDWWSFGEFVAPLSSLTMLNVYIQTQCPPNRRYVMRLCISTSGAFSSTFFQGHGSPAPRRVDRWSWMVFNSRNQTVDFRLQLMHVHEGLTSVNISMCQLLLPFKHPLDVHRLVSRSYSISHRICLSCFSVGPAFRAAVVACSCWVQPLGPFVSASCRLILPITG